MAIHCAIRKYGIDAFEISEIATAQTAEELNALESQKIKEYQADVRGIGYNLTSGGESPKQTPELIARLSALRKGQKRSLAVRTAMSEAQKKRWKERPVIREKGWNHYPETIEKMRARALARPPFSEQRKANMKAAINPEQRRLLGLKVGPHALHVKWHVRRNIIEASCEMCCKENNIEYIPLTPEQAKQRKNAMKLAAKHRREERKLAQGK